MRLNWKDRKAMCGGFVLYARPYDRVVVRDNKKEIETNYPATLFFGERASKHIGFFDSEAQAIEAAETAVQSIIDPAFWELHKGDVEKMVEEISSRVNEISNDELQGTYITEIQQRQLITAIIKKHLGGE